MVRVIVEIDSVRSVNDFYGDVAGEADRLAAEFALRVVRAGGSLVEVIDVPAGVRSCADCGGTLGSRWHEVCCA
jgi:hypothetical protein